MQKKRIVRMAKILALILLIPVVLTLFHVGGWQWGPVDFLVMFALLFGAGLVYEFFASKVESNGARILIAILVILGTAAVWIELAVDGVSRFFQSLS